MLMLPKNTISFLKFASAFIKLSHNFNDSMFYSFYVRGRFAAIVKGVDKKTDSVVVAKLLEINDQTNDKVEQEFVTLRTMRHERIAGLLAAYRQPAVATFILEKLQGADVLTFLASKHEYSEQVVATIVSQVCQRQHIKLMILY